MADRLPIYELESELLARLKEHRRVILSAPTGSGKSTQVPQMLLRHGLLTEGSAVILQPRRLAARLLAARVAEECATELGRDVGYQIRFDTVAGPETRIKFVTEGILLRQMIQDPKLTGVSTLIFDEFHERHLYGDITLARALDLQAKERPDLSLIVMSATLDVERLKTYLAPCTALTSEGRTWPVSIEYASPRRDDRTPVWEKAAGAFAQYVRDGGEGDALVFMPGAYEIGQTLNAIRERPEAKGFALLPLHGELAPRDQDVAVARQDRRKVVVSTNVAETSLTIDGIRLVIDSGLARISRYDAFRGFNTLLIENISRAAADQRAGRAGRTAPGTCIRLWSDREHGSRIPRETPEIKRLDLSEVVLTLKAAGVTDLRSFRWLEPPEEQALVDAEELLGDLGALKEGVLTPLGRRMLAFPVHPRWSRMLIAAQEYGCVYRAALVAALTQGRDLLLRDVDGATQDIRDAHFGGKTTSDFCILVRAWEFAEKNGFRTDVCRRAGIHAQTARQARPLLDQILRIAEREGLDIRRREASEDALRRCILIGFSDRVARRVDEGTLRCELVHGRSGVLDRESAVRKSPLLVVAEVREIEGRKLNTILRFGTEIDVPLLKELYPEDLRTRTHVYYDSGPKRVIAEEQICFRDLPLEKRKLDAPPPDDAARLLAAELLTGRLPLKGWDHGVDQWVYRLNLLSRACPELELAPITEEDRRTIIEHLCHGTASYKEIKERPVKPVVQEWVGPAMRGLVEKHTPERLPFPNGKQPRLTYAADAPPFVSLRIQELYGVKEIPRIALGRVTPLLHILAPNQRPVQITQDLAGFWREHYPRVKKELQRRYPKHEWRELS